MIKLMLPMEHLSMISGILLLELLKGVQPQVEAGEVIIKVFIKVDLIEHESPPLSHLLLLSHLYPLLEIEAYPHQSLYPHHHCKTNSLVSA